MDTYAMMRSLSALGFLLLASSCAVGSNAEVLYLIDGSASTTPPTIDASVKGQDAGTDSASPIDAVVFDSLFDEPPSETPDAGGCGTSCGNGTCSLGRCLTLLATQSVTVDGYDEFGSIAVDGTTLYLLVTGNPNALTPDTNGSLVSLPVGGGSLTRLYTADVPLNPLFFVRPEGIYLGGDKTIGRLPVQGGVPTPIVSLPSMADVTLWNVTATNLYWEADTVVVTDASCGADYPFTRILETQALSGGSPVTLASVDVTGPFGAEVGWSVFDVDDANFYLLAGVAGVNQGAASILALPLAGGTPTTLASVPGGVVSLAVDSQGVYWTDNSGNLAKVGLGGGAATTLATALTTGVATLFGADGTNIYWGGEGASGAGLMSIPNTGGSSVTLVSDPGFTFSYFAADATNLYFTDPTDAYQLSPK